MKRKVAMAMVAAMAMSAFTVPVFAETVDFSVTVPADILSRRAVKADSEQRFYVTGTSFNKTGRLDCRSINRKNSAIQSGIASISPSHLSSSASYYRNAPSRQYYYMTTSASVSNLHVTGRYTP